MAVDTPLIAATTPDTLLALRSVVSVLTADWRVVRADLTLPIGPLNWPPVVLARLDRFDWMSCPAVLSSLAVLALGRMLVSLCTDARRAATSWHTAEVDAELDAEGAAALGEELAADGEPPADAELLAEPPLELQAAGSSTKADTSMIRDARRGSPRAVLSFRAVDGTMTSPECVVVPVSRTDTASARSAAPTSPPADEPSRRARSRWPAGYRSRRRHG